MMGRSLISWSLRRLLVPAAIPVLVVLLTASWMSWPNSTGTIDVAAGREIFESRCAVCHFLRADVLGHTGPNLRSIGRDAATRRPELSGPEYLLQSILDPDAFVAPDSRPGMPRNLAAGLTSEQLKNLVGFLATRGATPDFRAIEQLEVADVPPAPDEPRNVTMEQMKLAERVIRDKAGCLDCHSPHHRPEYRALAPPVFGVGLQDREQLRLSIAEPDRRIVPHYEAAVVALRSGIVLGGRLLHQDDYQIVLLVVDADGKRTLRSIPVSEIDDEDGRPMIRKLDRSPMPSGYAELLSEEELSALLTLLQLLN